MFFSWLLTPVNTATFMLRLKSTRKLIVIHIIHYSCGEQCAEKHSMCSERGDLTWSMWVGSSYRKASLAERNGLRPKEWCGVCQMRMWKENPLGGQHAWRPWDLLGIKDDHRSFATPPIDRWHLILLPLNLGWLCDLLWSTNTSEVMLCDF